MCLSLANQSCVAAVGVRNETSVLSSDSSAPEVVAGLRCCSMTPCLPWQEGASRDTVIMAHRSCGRRSLAKDKSSRIPGILQWHLRGWGWKPCLNGGLEQMPYSIGNKMFNLLERIK